MSAPRLVNAKAIIAIKGFEITPVKFKNTGGAVTHCSTHPDLPSGVHLSIDNKMCVLTGTPLHVASRAVYTVTAENTHGSCTALIEITVNDAPIKTQREAIIDVHDKRHDLDTPRSQVEHALGDQAMMSSTIKPHEKFANQPMGDDNRLSNQVANNPDAENRAQNNPELTPSPTQQLQAQAVARATPQMAPKPGQ